MIKTAVEFLALSTLKRGSVKVRGQEVHFRELSVAERGKLLDVAGKDSANAPATLVALCATTPEGGPLFTEAQVADIAKSSPGVIDIVAQAIMRLSGMMAEETDPKG
jgi:hypothetical protein